MERNRRNDSRGVFGTLALALAVCLALALAAPGPGCAQPADTGQTGAEPEDSLELVTTTGEEIAPAAADEEVCEPPSIQEKLMIGVGYITLFAVCFFLLVKLLERHFISQDRNARLGRNAGISLSLVLSGLGLVALAFLVTGCLHAQFVGWFIFVGALFLIHLLYTAVTAARS